MREYLLTAALAAIFCFMLTPLVRQLAMISGAYIELRSRDMHTDITPRWGGLAMWGSMSITFLIVSHLHLVGPAFGRELTGFLPSHLISALSSRSSS